MPLRTNIVQIIYSCGHKDKTDLELVKLLNSMQDSSDDEVKEFVSKGKCTHCSLRKIFHGI
jgi:hypothetical protein